MRISLERTGGFAGISKRVTVDTNNLAPEEAKQLPCLLETADFFNLPATITTPSKERDRFQYTLTVEDSDRQHTVTVSEAALPATLRSLIEWVNTVVKSQ